MIPLAALFLVAASRLGAPAAAQLPDACSLLDRDDVAAVQGEPYVETKLTTNGKLSRCFYQLPTFTASVSLDLIEDRDESFWQANFEEPSRLEPDRPSKPGREEAGKELSPIPVSGVGDEAFWVGNVAGPTLWIRSDGLALRVSAGGSGSQAEKLERSKRLAIKALEKIAKATAGRSADATPEERRAEP